MIVRVNEIRKADALYFEGETNPYIIDKVEVYGGLLYLYVVEKFTYSAHYVILSFNIHDDYSTGLDYISTPKAISHWTDVYSQNWINEGISLTEIDEELKKAYTIEKLVNNSIPPIMQKKIFPKVKVEEKGFFKSNRHSKFYQENNLD